MMCDGASRDEVLFARHATIERYGWALVAVGDSPPTADWIYTIGLAPRGHPELVIVGHEQAVAGALLNELGERIRDGERFQAGDSTMAGHVQVGFVAVDPAHIERGLLNAWLDYYGALGPPHPDLHALQVVLPDGQHCHTHQTSQPLLDTPFDVMQLGGNRAERRARRRAARHRGPHPGRP